MSVAPPLPPCQHGTPGGCLPCSLQNASAKARMYPTKFVQLVVLNGYRLTALDDAGDVWLHDAPNSRWIRLEATRAVERTTTPDAGKP